MCGRRHLLGCRVHQWKYLSPTHAVNGDLNCGSCWETLSLICPEEQHAAVGARISFFSVYIHSFPLSVCLLWNATTNGSTIDPHAAKSLSVNKSLLMRNNCTGSWWLQATKSTVQKNHKKNIQTHFAGVKHNKIATRETHVAQCTRSGCYDDKRSLCLMKSFWDKEVTLDSQLKSWSTAWWVRLIEGLPTQKWPCTLCVKVCQSPQNKNMKTKASHIKIMPKSPWIHTIKPQVNNPFG